MTDGAEVGDVEVDAVEHERGDDRRVRKIRRDRVTPREVGRAEPVERAQQQHATVGQRVRAGVLIAGARVEVEQEEIRREQRVEPRQARPLLVVAHRRAAGDELVDVRPSTA